LTEKQGGVYTSRNFYERKKSGEPVLFGKGDNMMQKIITILITLIMVVGISVAQDMKPLEGGDLIVVEREIEEPTEQEAIDEACRLAVQSCAGRIYFSDKLIMARSLLIKYIDHYYKKFVFSMLIDDKKHVGDKIHINAKIFVDYSKLIKDMEEKGFLFRPRMRPFFIVFLKETLDESPAPSNHGWETVRSAWKDITGQREPEEEIMIPPSNMDISQSPPFMTEAIRVAQKTGAELILSGNSTSVRQERKEFYYQTYTFYKTTINLKLIRVDTKKVLKETTVSSQAGSESQNQAIQLSITRAARKAVNELAKVYNAQWENSVLTKGDYLFLFSGVTDEKLNIIKKHLEALDSEAKFFVRNRYADVAVVNFMYTGNKELLIFTLEKMSYPRMHILREHKNRFEIQIKN